MFSATSLVCDVKDGNKQTARIFTPWTVIEDNYRKIDSQDEFSMKPRFYNLSTTDFNNQDTPKLDGVVGTSWFINKLIQSNFLQNF